jgi:cytoskeleton protein RodZ
MISVGDTLRRERIKRNLQLEQISKELKISPRFLEAIEDERFEKLPGGVFAKAFVRQYGRLLGLNEEELASQLDQMLEPPADLAIENPQVVKAGLAPVQMPRMEEWQSVGDRRVTWSGPLSAAIVVVLVMLICSGVYAWIQRQHNPVVAHNSVPASVPASVPVPAQQAPPEPQTAAPPPTTPPATETPATQPTEPPAAAVSPAPVQQPQSDTAAAETAKNQPAQAQPAQTQAENTPPPAPNPNAPVRIEITATEPVWILARTDGKFAFTGTMDANTQRTVDASKEIILRLGNAGGVTITLNGQPVPPLGPKGQPRTIQFTSGGFHIVPAKPPSDPPAPIARL